MSQAHRLITNTLLMQSRMVITVGMGILTTSLLLRHLGDTDYGLWMAVSAVINLAVFPLDALRLSCQRQLSHAIGLGDPVGVQRAYSSMLCAFCVLGLLIFVAGLVPAVAVSHLLEVPVAREHAAMWTFALVVVVTAASAAATPILALILGHQDLQVVAAFELISSIVRLGIAIALPYLPGDRLMVLMSLITGWSIIIHLVMIGVTRRMYPSVRPMIRGWSAADTKTLFAFAGWSSLEAGAWRGVLNGNAIILNRVFGPEANAAYAVATQAGGYISSLTATFRRVTEPATIAAHAAGAARNFERLVLATSKYSVTLGCGLALVLILWAPAVLKLWLGEVPESAAVLTRWVVAGMLLDMATKGHELGLIADGRIRAMSIASVCFFALTVCAAVAGVVVADVGADVAGMAFFGMHLMTGLYRLFVVGPRLSIPARSWLRAVFIPCGLVVLTTGASIWTCTPIAERHPWSILPAIVLSTLIGAALGWVIVLTHEERASFLSLFRKVTGNVVRLRRGGDANQTRPPAL